MAKRKTSKKTARKGKRHVAKKAHKKTRRHKKAASRK